LNIFSDIRPIALVPGSLLKSGGRREPGNIHRKTVDFWRYQSDCRTKPCEPVTIL